MNLDQNIRSAKSELKKSFGATMSEEIGDILASMTGLFDENFNLLRSRLDELEANIVNAIK